MSRRGGSSRRTEVPRELVERARQDREAFGEIYDHYLPRVYAFCRLYCASPEEAEDATAQTFERALSAIGRYEDRGAPFSSWLLRIASNAMVDGARRASRVQETLAPTTGEPDHTRIQQWETAFWLRTHLRALPTDQQEVVRLRFFEDCSFRDIAQRMGRSEPAVKQLLRRALQALHARIQEEAPVDGE